MRYLLISLVALAATLVTACSGDPGRWQSFDEQGWRYGDTLTFEGDWADLDSVYINIYHTDSYRYSNLWIEMSYATSHGASASDSTFTDSVVADTFNIMLADPAGRWRGHGNGLTYNLSTAVHPSHPVVKGAPLHLRHIMRVDTLLDIDKIGLHR